MGNATISHTIDDGFILKGNYRGKDYVIQRSPLQIDGLHVEYDYFRIKRDDCFVINTNSDSFFLYPKKKNVITKLAFATEELFLYKKNNIK